MLELDPYRGGTSPQSIDHQPFSSTVTTETTYIAYRNPQPVDRTGQLSAVSSLTTRRSSRTVCSSVRVSLTPRRPSVTDTARAQFTLQTRHFVTDTARAQFKEYVNMLASIKLEDGEKFLVLKRKYRQGLLAEVLSDVGSEYSYVSQSTAGSTPDPPDLGLPPPRAPPPYRPPPPAPFPGPAPYQPPGAHSPTYRTVAAPAPPPARPASPYGAPLGPPGTPYGGPSSPAAVPGSLGLERSPALDEYYHVPESRPMPAAGRPADPQPLGLPPAPPPELLSRPAPRRQAPLPAPAEPPEWRPPPPSGEPPERRPPLPTELPVDRRSPPPSSPSVDSPSAEPAPPVPPRRRSAGKENLTPPPSSTAASAAEADAAAREVSIPSETADRPCWAARETGPRRCTLMCFIFA